MEDLLYKKCKPCEGGMPPLNKDEVSVYLSQINSDWSVEDNAKIKRKLKFKNFRDAIEFINKIAVLAEEEGHHPDFCVNYNKVFIELTTHAIKGLSQNDFIVAKKIENIYIGMEAA